MSAPNINSGNKTSDEEIWSGMKFHDANQDPVKLKGYDAHLQLFVSEGCASARLFINTSFTDWRTVFYNSWVGFYANDNINTLGKYYTFQWAVKFNKVSPTASGNQSFDIYEYQSSMLMFDGVQARFILTSGDELARTPRWVSQIPVPVPIKDEPALLQIYNNTGYASARLYIKKTFNDWKNEFYYSWVGFYADGDKNDDEYNNNRWQWAVKFTKEISSKCDEYDVYEYQSVMPLSSGVQARFMLKSGDRRAHTAPWNDIGK